MALIEDLPNGAVEYLFVTFGSKLRLNEWPNDLDVLNGADDPKSASCGELTLRDPITQGELATCNKVDW